MHFGPLAFISVCASIYSRRTQFAGDSILEAQLQAVIGLTADAMFLVPLLSRLVATAAVVAVTQWLPGVSASFLLAVRYGRPALSCRSNTQLDTGSSLAGWYL